MIELIEMVEKHNTLIAINYPALGFASQSASTMTSTYTGYTDYYQ